MANETPKEPKGRDGCFMRVISVAFGVVIGLALLLGACVALVGSASDSISEQEQADDSTVEVTLEICEMDGLLFRAGGVASHQAEENGGVTMDINLLAEDGTILGTRFASVENLDPGQNGKWSATFSDPGQPAKCEITKVEYAGWLGE